MLKRQRQQLSGTDRLQDELRLLEKRLLTHRGGRKGTEASATDRRKKLREELEKDGFDLELQSILDSILGTGAGCADFEKPDAGKSNSDGDSRDSDGLRCGGFSDLESGFHASDDEATRIEAMSAPKVFEAQDAVESRPQPEAYVAPHRRQEASKTDAATASGLTVEAVKVEIVRALNRISEGNAESVFHQLLRVLQRNSAKLQSHHNSGKQSSEVHAYTVDSCIKSRFSTNSLIATETALCCALSKLWDMELCREFLRSLAVCFSTYFAESLSLRTQQPEVVVTDTASLVTRHSVVGLCCLYDFGFVSARLFVELIRRVAGLRDIEAPKECTSSLSDYRVELLLLLLRLGGGKLRQDDANLFTSTWKQLQELVHAHEERAGPRPDRGASHAADELPAEAGRLRALIMELQDLKAGKQKDRLMLVKASQDAMRRWLSSNSVFGPTLLTSQYQIDGSWDALEKGERPDLSKAGAAAADFQRHQRLRAKNVAAAADATIVGSLASSIQHKASLLRRLLNLGKLTAFLIRVGITDLRIVRFLSFESSVEGHSPMGLTGKLGVFLREVCIEVLSIPTLRASSPAPENGLKEVAARYFSCLRSMSDICEVFIALLQDVVLPIAEPDGRSWKKIRTAQSSEGGRAIKASIVNAALNALLSHQRSEP
ncbi:hypothetical protein Emag_000023 [Eimeria magna]